MNRIVLTLVALAAPLCLWAQIDESRPTAENPIKSSNNIERVYTIFDKYKDVQVNSDATINTESPAWAIDRLSILALKIYHMRQEVERTDTTPEHHAQCEAKLNVLLEQQKDLSSAIDQLIEDIENGRKYMKVYKQMKMYNDPNLNPVLYGKK